MDTRVHQAGVSRHEPHQLQRPRRRVPRVAPLLAAASRSGSAAGAPASSAGRGDPQQQPEEAAVPQQAYPVQAIRGVPRSAALVARRAQKAQEAQRLTARFTAASSWRELEHLFGEHKGQMNHIHLSAMLTRLAHLAALPPASPTHLARPAAVPSDRRATATAGGWTKHELPAVRMFMAHAVPYVGLHMLSLGPRQLASVMWALGRLGYLPEPALVTEWAACVARKLNAFTGRDLAMAAWGLVACGATRRHATASGAPHVLAKLASAATQPHAAACLQARDVANLAWALATSVASPSGPGGTPAPSVPGHMAAGGVCARPPAPVLVALVSRAEQLLVRSLQARLGVPPAEARDGQHTGSAWPGPTAPAPSNVKHQASVEAAVALTEAWSQRPQQERSHAQLGLQEQPWPRQAASSQPPGPGLALQPQRGPGGPAQALLLEGAASTGWDQGSFSATEVCTLLWALARLRFHPGGRLLLLATHHFCHLCLEAGGAGGAGGTNASEGATPVGGGGAHGSARPAGGAQAATHGAAAETPPAPRSAALLAPLPLPEDRQARPPAPGPQLHSPAPGPPALHMAAAGDWVAERRPALTVQPRLCATFLWSLAQLGFLPEPREQVQVLLEGALGPPAAAPRALTAPSPPLTSPADLVQLMWALGRLGFRAPPASQQRLCQVLAHALAATVAAADAGDSDSAAAAAATRLQRLPSAPSSPGSTAHAQRARGSMWHAGGGGGAPAAADEGQASSEAAAARLVAAAGGARCAAAALSAPELACVLVGLARMRLPLPLPSVLCTLCRHALLTLSYNDGGDAAAFTRRAGSILGGGSGASPRSAGRRGDGGGGGGACARLRTLAPSLLLRLGSACALLHLRPPARFTAAWAAACAPLLPVLPASALARLLASLVMCGHRPHCGFLLAARRRVGELMHTPEELQWRAQVVDRCRRGLGTGHHGLPEGGAGRNGDDGPAPAGHGGIAAVRAPRTAGALPGSGVGAGEDSVVAAPGLSPQSVPSGAWQGRPGELVLVLWALGRLRVGPLPGAWAAAAAACAARLAPALRPAELLRLAGALRVLRVRPRVQQGAALAKAMRRAASMRAASMRCNVLCNISLAKDADSSLESGTAGAGGGLEHSPTRGALPGPGGSSSTSGGSGGGMTGAAVGGAAATRTPGSRRARRPCHVPPCNQLRAVVSRLRAWQRALAAEESKGRVYRAPRSYLARCW